MMRNKVYTIVEGKGEAHPLRGKPAIVILVQKLLTAAGCYDLFPAEKYPPFRLPYGQFFSGNKFENALRLHKKHDDCAAVLILLDMDNDCATEKAAALAARVRHMEPLPFSVVIVCAVREYEAWFLASLESIHSGHTYPGDPETRRDAKGWLRQQFKYRPTHDQAAYTQHLDVTLAYERSRSFRRLHHAVTEIQQAINTNAPVITPHEA